MMDIIWDQINFATHANIIAYCVIQGLNVHNVQQITIFIKAIVSPTLLIVLKFQQGLFPLIKLQYVVFVNTATIYNKVHVYSVVCNLEHLEFVRVYAQ